MLWEYNHNDQELYHYGRKGMRWGVRRYQNKDGTLTNAGKSRYNQDKLDQNNDKVSANPNKWVRDDISNAKQLADSGANLSRNLSKLNDEISKSKPKVKMDLSSMSDQQMRNEINRALLERQYNDLFAPSNVSKGKERIDKILRYSESVLTVGSSALAIALAIRRLR